MSATQTRPSRHLITAPRRTCARRPEHRRPPRHRDAVRHRPRPRCRRGSVAPLRPPRRHTSAPGCASWRRRPTRSGCSAGRRASPSGCTTTAARTRRSSSSTAPSPRPQQPTALTRIAGRTADPGRTRRHRRSRASPRRRQPLAHARHEHPRLLEAASFHGLLRRPGTRHPRASGADAVGRGRDRGVRSLSSRTTPFTRGSFVTDHPRSGHGWRRAWTPCRRFRGKASDGCCRTTSPAKWPPARSWWTAC